MELFARTLGVLGGGSLDAEALWPIAGQLGPLDHLTPGDFANVRRQARVLRRTLGPAELLERVAGEAAAKRAETAARVVGFGR